MGSVFRLHPTELKNKIKFLGIKKINTYNYDFLDIIKEKYDIDINIYYEIINSIEIFKLKNIFYYINFRLQKINKKLIYENDIKQNDFNLILNNFINNEIVNSIIIMNFIQQYIYPIK